MLKGKRIVGIVQARMSSTRLPGKVLLPLAGKPVLKRIIERMKKSKYLDEIMIATSIRKADDKIVKFCQKNKIKYYAGSENDVLKRVLQAAVSCQADVIVAITGDCPLVDYRFIDKVVKTLINGPYDYVSNAIVITFPDGFDVEAFYTKVLEKVDKLTQDPSDREHVTYYIYNHPKTFRLKNIKAKGKMYWPDLGLTLDEEKDYELLNIIYKKLLPKNRYFSARQVVDFLRQNPEFTKINKYIQRKAISHRVKK